MTERLIYLLCVLFFLVLLVALMLFVLAKTLHLLQLNGYSNRKTLEWLLQHKGHYGLLRLPLRHAKKPLVWTARVFRLLAFSILFMLIAAALFGLFLFREQVPSAIEFILYYSPSLLLLGLALLVLCPVFALLANLAAVPLERAIKSKYIRETRDILAAHEKLIIIGITGSYGKTSMKHYLHTLLSGKYSVLMTPENYNTPMGVAITVREQLQATHEIFLCEMGARHKGEIAELCEIVQPHFGIITAVGEQHLETFGQVETVIQTKFELAQFLSRAWASGAKLFCNNDNLLIQRYISSAAFIDLGLETITYGTSRSLRSGNYSAKRIETSLQPSLGSSFAVAVTPLASETTHRKPYTISGLHTQLVGKHNIQNITGAIAVATELGLDETTIKQRVSRLVSAPHRLELKDCGSYVLLDDAYNSNPAGAAAALEVLSQLEGYKILITPGMIELGTSEAAENAVFGSQAAKVCDIVFLEQTKQSAYVHQGLIAKGFPLEQIVQVASFNEAFGLAIGMTQSPKVILIENDLPDNY